MSKRTLSEYFNPSSIYPNISEEPNSEENSLVGQDDSSSSSKKPKTLPDFANQQEDANYTTITPKNETLNNSTSEPTINNNGLSTTSSSSSNNNNHTTSSTVISNNNSSSSGNDNSSDTNLYECEWDERRSFTRNRIPYRLFDETMIINDDLPYYGPQSTHLYPASERFNNSYSAYDDNDGGSDYDAQLAQALQNSLDEDAALPASPTTTNSGDYSTTTRFQCSNYDTRLISTPLLPATSYYMNDNNGSSSNNNNSEPNDNFKNNSNQKNSNIVETLPTHNNANSSSSSQQETSSSTSNTRGKSTLSSTRKRTRTHSIEDEDVLDNTYFTTTNTNNNKTTNHQFDHLHSSEEQENYLLLSNNTMPIQSSTTTTGSESSDGDLSSQNSKRFQQVTGGANSSSNEPTTNHTSNGDDGLNTTTTTDDMTTDQSSSNLVNNKKTLLFSDNATHKHLICILSKNAGEVSHYYQIAVKLDENGPFSCKSEPPTKQGQFIISGKSDLKRFIELISEHTNLPVTTVCFKKTLGGRQKIIPLSTKLPAVFDKITVQKPVSLFINGTEFLELDYNNMYTDAGNDLFREKKYEESLECYNTSYKHSPTDSRVLSNRSLCLIKLNRFYEAFCDLSLVIASDKTETVLLEKAYHRRAHALYEITKNLKVDEEMEKFVNTLVSNTRVKDESMGVKLHFLCLKDMHHYLEKVGILGDYATYIRKKEIELNDVKLIKPYHYLLQHAPKLLNYCLISKKEGSDLKLSTVFPSSIYTPENKDSSLIYTPLPFCSREWYDSEMAAYEELFCVKLWKPFYDNNETIQGKTLSSKELYKFILFTAFKYLLSKPDFNTFLTNETNAKCFSKMLIYLAFNAGVPPKAYLYINNKSDETKESMRDYVHQNVVEYIHIQVRDFHFIVEFKQPASSTFSTTDSSYGAKENRVKHGSDTFVVRVGDELPAELLEQK